jgi:hypothetical protein
MVMFNKLVDKLEILAILLIVALSFIGLMYLMIMLYGTIVLVDILTSIF